MNCGNRKNADPNSQYCFSCKVGFFRKPVDWRQLIETESHRLRRFGDLYFDADAVLYTRIEFNASD